ncbi:glycosyltransferase [Algihabitans albus]|uniref:glycosyltransferase n=1 Tax=Algihabitans albus TaxID=2164067 RepID=UPI000E5CE105|nr:glycosyltransferase [Algihabitans albus]
MLTGLAAASLLIWIVLLLFRGGFWRGRERFVCPPEADENRSWPAAAVCIPARNEADVLSQTLRSVLTQDYAGPFHVVLADDASTDGTGDLARRLAVALGAEDRLTVIAPPPLPEGWTGKLWALNAAVAEAERVSPEARYLWFTDADILHDPDNLRCLIAKAETEDLDLTSQMVELACVSFWDRLLVPAFVFFFAKLYPFGWVNDPSTRTAAAAGGCLLLRCKAFARAGGLAPVRDRIIDDCAIGQQIKRHGRPADAKGRAGRLWLGTSGHARSARAYESLGEIWRMVTRSAYTQLHHSPWLLAGTLLGMMLIYLVPPAIALTWPLHGTALAGLTALTVWLAMALALMPTLRQYRQPLWLALLLPLAAVLYTGMTLDSARRYHSGRGGGWKGRNQAAGTGQSSASRQDSPESH